MHSNIERDFIEQAEEGCFLVGYFDDQRPYALGAKNTGNLFSMRVLEEDDICSDGSVYFLP